MEQQRRTQIVAFEAEQARRRAERESWWNSLSQDEQAQILREQEETKRKHEDARRQQEEDAAVRREQEEREHSALVAERRSRYGTDAEIRQQIESIRSSARYPARGGPINEYRRGMSILGWVILMQIPTWIIYAAILHGQPAPHGFAFGWFIGSLVVTGLLLALWSASHGAALARYHAVARKVTRLESQLGCGVGNCWRCR